MSVDVAPRSYGFYSTAPSDMVAERGLAPGDPRHGTPNGYGNHGCRCDDCKAAQSAANRQRRRKRLASPIPDRVHGTDNGYSCYKCKCPDCSAVGRANRRAQYTPSPRRALERADTEAMYADYTTGMSIEQVAQKWGLSPGAIYSRFNRAGLKRRDTAGISAGMYIDYCTGMTTAEVAQKWGVSTARVTQRFKQLGVPLRPRTGGTVQIRIADGVSFAAANSERAAIAGTRRANAAREALPRTVDLTHRQVLQLRIADPTASLTELGARCEPAMTKDAFASHLRRALENAGVTS